MSSADQKKILDQLPTNLSEKRRKIIETALSAVGKIPYHFGDSASYPGLEKNHFGTKAAPDEKVEAEKGLIVHTLLTGFIGLQLEITWEMGAQKH